MFDRENPEKNMCGPLAYEYPYLQGVKDGFLNAFEVCVDMYTEESNNSLYEIIARSILSPRFIAFMTDSKASLGMNSRMTLLSKTLEPKYSDTLTKGLVNTAGLWASAVSKPRKREVGMTKSGSNDD